MKDTGVVVLGHGSRAPGSSRGFEALRAVISSRIGRPVQTAYLQFSEPAVREAVQSLVEDGVTNVLIVPLFLSPGHHVLKDIPREVDNLKKAHPTVSFFVSKHIGQDARVVDMVSDAVFQASGAQREADPSSIEAASMAYIDEMVDELALGSVERAVVSRICHAAGDLSVMDLVGFSGDAAGIVSGLGEGRDVIVDVEMVRSGINSAMTGRLGCSVKCLVGEAETASAAKAEGGTRSAVGIRRCLETTDLPLVVIGNAPTALEAVCDYLVDGGRVLGVVGTPVGFIGAADSKRRLSGLPGTASVFTRGPRGGSGWAAAATNALLKLAIEEAS